MFEYIWVSLIIILNIMSELMVFAEYNTGFKPVFLTSFFLLDLTFAGVRSSICSSCYILRFMKKNKMIPRNKLI